MKTHAKARRREEEKSKTEFSSPVFLRAFAASRETSPIRNRLLRLTADSLDLLAIIKQEGKVLNLTRRREAAKIRQRKQIDFNLLNSFAASRLRVRNRLQPTSP